jgi:hypothetical protein
MSALAIDAVIDTLFTLGVISIIILVSLEK